MATVEFFVNKNNSTDGLGFVRADGDGSYWAVSFDTGDDDTGTGTDPAVDDTLTFSTSTKTGTVKKIILKSGAWDTGDAAGILIFAVGVAGTTPGDGETITFSSGGTAVTNIIGGAGLWDNLNGDAGAFTTLALAEASLDGYDDWTADDIEVWCSGSNSADSTDALFSGFAAVPNTIKVAGDDGSADGVTAYNGEGKNTGQTYSTSFYRRTHRIYVDVASTWTIADLQWQRGDTCIDSAGATDITTERCLFNCPASSGTNTLYHKDVGTVRNCIFIGTDNTGRGITTWAAGLTGRNNVFSLLSQGVNGTGTNWTNFYNNLYYNNTSDNSHTDSPTNIAKNATDSATDIYGDTGTINSISTANDIVSASDFTPVFGGLIYEAGSTSGLPSDDYFGTSRGASPTNPDIGAIHQTAPVCFVNTDNAGTQNGSADATGYDDIVAAEAAIQTNRLNDNRQPTIRCSGATVDPTNHADFDGGWDAGDESHRWIIEANRDAAISDGWNKSNSPEISTSHYHMLHTTSFNYCLEIANNNYVTVRGLQLESDSGSLGHCFGLTGTSSNCILEACRMHMHYNSGSAFDVNGSGTGNIIRNNFAENDAAVALTDACFNGPNAATGITVLHNWFRSNGSGRGMTFGNSATFLDCSGNMFDNCPEEVRNTGTFTNQDNNATDALSFSSTRVSTNGFTSITSTTDYQSATDIRPTVGGDLDSKSTIVSPSGYDLTGTVRTDDNVGPMWESVAAAAGGAFSYGVIIG